MPHFSISVLFALAIAVGKLAAWQKTSILV